jgi:hypothetical protein
VRLLARKDGRENGTFARSSFQSKMVSAGGSWRLWPRGKIEKCRSPRSAALPPQCASGGLLGASRTRPAPRRGHRPATRSFAAQ